MEVFAYAVMSNPRLVRRFFMRHPAGMRSPVSRSALEPVNSEDLKHRKIPKVGGGQLANVAGVVSGR